MDTLPSLLKDWRFWLVAGLLGGLAAAGYHRYPKWRAGQYLRAAQDSSSERTAFEYIRRSGQVLFTVHDARGAQIDMSEPGWRSRVHSVHFLNYGSTPVQHVLIDQDNLIILLGE